MDAWSRFWKEGHFTTFGNYFAAGYEGPVKEWMQQLKPLLSPPVERTLHITELCCGNGSLLPFLIEHAPQFAYTGIDRASVQLPERLEHALHPEKQSANLLANSNVEQLPSTLHNADLAVSIYGIEYSDLQRTLASLRQHLVPSGKLFALLHHADSVVARLSRRAIAEYQEHDMSAVCGALASISEVLDQVPLSELKHNPRAEAARELVNATAARYLGQPNNPNANAFMADFVSSSLRFFKLLREPRQAREYFIEELKRETLAALERHQQMLNAASDSETIAALSTHMARTGWVDVSTTVIQNKEEIIGWQLSAQSQS
jgi:ubiquinone/menaquinone biosynthesis C-methylase UbiE